MSDMENLYNVQCSFSLQQNSCSEKVNFLSAQSSNDQIALTYEKRLILVDDCGTSSSTSVNLDSAVDVICWSSDGKLVALGDSAGSIFIFCLPGLKKIFTKSIKKFKETLDTHSVCFTSMSCSSYEGSYTLVSSLNNGRVHIIKNINITPEKQGISYEQETWIDCLNCHEDGLTSIISFFSSHNHMFFSSGFGTKSIAVWKQPIHQKDYNYFTSVDTKSIQILTGNKQFDGAKKMQIHSYVFCMCKNGFLYQFALPHLFLLKYYTSVSFVDFLVKMPEKIINSKRSQKCKIYGIQEVENSYSVGVFDWINLDKIFTTFCAGKPSLVTNPNSRVDFIYIDNCEKSDDENERKVGIFKLNETSPESRLSVFLQQNQFQEAVNFAEKFNLDLQPVYQQQASYLLRVLSSSSDSNFVTNLFDQFKQCVSKITDPLFIEEICVNCSSKDLSIVYELLKLARDHLDSGGRAYRATVCDDDYDYINLSLQVDRLLDLLVTFQTTFGSRDGSMWHHFKTSRLSEQVASLLHDGNLQAATVISSRHENSLISDLEAGGEKHFRNLLRIVAEDANVNDLVAWLELIIPAFLTSSIANCVEILTEWLHKRTLSLEEASPHWPDDGIKLASVFFKVQKKLSTVGFVRNQLSSTYLLFNNKEEIMKLKLLASRLQMLKTLRSRYHCNILLDEFVQETTVSLTFRMLDKVSAPELIPRCLDNTVRPYMKEHKLDQDATLLLYIKELLGTSNKQAFGKFRTLKERKVIAIINNLTDDKVVVEASLLLAKRSSIPWSNSMQEIVRRALTIADAHPTSQASMDDEEKSVFSSLKSQLTYCVNLEKIPAIASKYDVNIVSNSLMVNHEVLMKRILKDDREEALDDAEMIASTFSPTPMITAYSYRLLLLIQDQRISDCIQLLDSHLDNAFELVQRATLRTFTILKQTHEMWREDRANHCLACVSMIGHLLQKPGCLSPSSVRECSENMIMLKNIHHLQTRFDEFISVEEYMNKPSCDLRLAKNVLRYYTNSNSLETRSNACIHTHDGDSSSLDASRFQDKQSKSPAESIDESGDKNHERKQIKSFSMLLNLARLLNVPEEEMLSEIALQAASKCQGQAAIDICRDLFLTQPSPKTIEILEKIAITLLRLLEDRADVVCRLIPDICELVSLAAIYCKENRLVDVIVLSSLSRLSRDVLLGTDLSAGDFLSKCAAGGATTRTDKYESTEWLNTWFAESDVLTLNSSTVLPLVSRILQSIIDKDGISLVSIPPNAGLRKSLESLFDLVAEMTSSLKNSHRVTSSIQWISRIETIVTSHVSNSPDFFRSNANNEVPSNVSNLIKYSYKEKKDLIETLLQKIFFMRQLDLPLAVSSLLFLPHDLAFSILRGTWESNSRNFVKISALSLIALKVGELSENHCQRSKYESLLVDANWCQRLHSVKISTDGFLLASNHWKQKFLHSLLEHPAVNGSLLFDFCRDYDLDCDTTLLRYVDVLLSDGNPGRSQLNSIDSPDSCLVQYSQISALIPANTKLMPKTKTNQSSANQSTKSWSLVKEELKWISCKISDKLLLIEQLEKCFRNVLSPYDYDKAEFLIQLLQTLTDEINPKFTQQSDFFDKGRQLINYLRYIDREQPPTDVELQRRWNSDARAEFRTHDLPPFAYQRLPLHPLLYGDVTMTWKVLSSEASEKSAKFLVPIAKLLNLNPDKLYMTAAENVITRSMNSSKSADLNSQQFEKLRKLTDKIESRKMAVAMAKRISEMLPPSQEKVDAYKWCLTLISKWHDALPEGSSDHVMLSNANVTLTRHYKHASCEVALVKYGCDSPDHISLLNQPSNLILHLYHHPSIVQRHHEPGDKYPDIHSLVDELGLIHDIDVTKLRLTLTINLLLASNKNEQDNDDSTVTIDRMRSTAMLEDNVNQVQDEELIRLLYLLTYGDPSQQGKYLMKVIGNHQDKRITNSCRVRALHCLFRVVDDDQKLYSLTNKTTDELRSDLRVLIYMAELEEANFKVPASLLRQHDKTSVARSVISSSARQRNPAALRVAAEMCREFGSVPTDLWTVLLQQLVSLQEISYLQRLLPDICRLPSVHTLPCLASVWQSCVTLPLVALTSPLDAKQKSVAFSSYHFLLRCPVLLRIDLNLVAERFRSLELDVLALACFLISPSGQGSARKVAHSMSHEIKQQLLELNNEQQNLLGCQLINDFLADY